MADPRHLDWLLEGVEAWNARRREDDFTPDLSGADIRRAFTERGALTGDLTIPLVDINLNRADLSGANLFGADLRRGFLEHANLTRAQLNGADMEAATLYHAELEGAFLVEVNLRSVLFFGASLKRAHLAGADLSGAQLQQIHLEGANLKGAKLEGTSLRDARLTNADVRTRVWRQGASRRGVLVTDLSATRWLTQAQLETMQGDRGTILPARLTHPEHWPRAAEIAEDSEAAEGAGPPTADGDGDPSPAGPPPPVPEPGRASGQPAVRLEGGRLNLTTTPPPARADLSVLYDDLREDIQALAGSGSFSNISAVFDTAFGRFVAICAVPFAALDQVRFGVQASAVRLHLEGHREEIAAIAPEKAGALEAALLAAGLLCERLPGWQAFLAETAPEAPAAAAGGEAIGAALAEAAEALAEDPGIDPGIPETLREHVATATARAYLAGAAMLGDVARAILGGLRDVLLDTAREGRKIAVKGLATTLVTGAGSSLAKLAGLMPAEFEWVLPWLKYVPAVLG